MKLGLKPKLLLELQLGPHILKLLIMRVVELLLELQWLLELRLVQHKLE